MMKRLLVAATHHLLPPPEIQPLATFGAVLATALSAVVSGVNLFLGAMLLVFMLVDQIAGVLKAVILSAPGEDWYDSRKFMLGFAKNGLLLLGVITAGLMEMVSLHVPAWGPVAEELTPLTKIALAYAITGKLASILHNVSAVKEARLLVAFMTRRFDAAKLGAEPPTRRHYDAGAVEVERTLDTPSGDNFRDAALRRDQERGQ